MVNVKDGREREIDGEGDTVSKTRVCHQPLSLVECHPFIIGLCERDTAPATYADLP